MKEEEFWHQLSLQADLWDLCKNFIKDQKISCCEAVVQSDRVILNAYDFIYNICEIVGYYEDEDE